MNSFKVLFFGEIQRMSKYGILMASIATSLIWIGVLHFSDIKDMTHMFPLILFLDATTMSMIFVGVMMFYEKQENTIKTLLVTPINKTQYIWAKVSANISSNIFTLVLLVSYGKLFKELNVNIFALLSVVIITSLIHSLIGFIILYNSEDFTGLLMNVFKYSFIFIIPVILEQIGLINNEIISKILFIIPTKSAMILFNATINAVYDLEVLISFIYLVILSVVIFILVKEKFDDYAIKESGA